MINNQPGPSGPSHPPAVTAPGPTAPGPIMPTPSELALLTEFNVEGTTRKSSPRDLSAAGDTST